MQGDMLNIAPSHHIVCDCAPALGAWPPKQTFPDFALGPEGDLIRLPRRRRPAVPMVGRKRTTDEHDEFPPPHGIFSPLAENHLLEILIRSSSESYAPHRSKMGR
jgi:hypothetical protein